MHASVLIAKLATRITWPLTRLDRSRARLDPPVLCYHRVLPRVKKNGKQPPYSVTPEQFREQLRLLVSEGFVSLTLQEFCEAAADLRELPSRSVLITFDDGFNDNYLLAWPIAREFNMKLNLFVCTGLVAGNTLGVFDRDLKVERESQTAFPNLWEPLRGCGLREMKAGGVDVGFHSHTHRNFGMMSDEEIAKDVELGTSLFSEEIGVTPKSFAFP